MQPMASDRSLLADVNRRDVCGQGLAEQARPCVATAVEPQIATGYNATVRVKGGPSRSLCRSCPIPAATTFPPPSRLTAIASSQAERPNSMFAVACWTAPLAGVRETNRTSAAGPPRAPAHPERCGLLRYQVSVPLEGEESLALAVLVVVLEQRPRVRDVLEKPGLCGPSTFTLYGGGISGSRACFTTYNLAAHAGGISREDLANMAVQAGGDDVRGQAALFSARKGHAALRCSSSAKMPVLPLFQDATVGGCRRRGKSG
ncbi:hypothetical protein DL771_002449 [Monosporascus sp. 5C6A]|nr:hypothetical protein DL771_002449 [Monosporascus sp. 5C6A]